MRRALTTAGGMMAGMIVTTGSAAAQVVINEVWENPPGDGSLFDANLEFIELYGVPGTDLTGYAIGLFKGGTDLNGDGFLEAFPEIDEAFTLDGVTIGSSGFVVLYNNIGGASPIPTLVAPGTVLRTFGQSHIPSTDVAGNLANDDSSTYLLVRRRPDHQIVNGASVYGPFYAFRKEPNPDVNFDSRLDFGNESGSAFQIEPLQIIDEVAWSNNGGKEYTRSSENEISDTPGFNPDGASRLRYLGANPLAGLRIDGSGATVPTRTADEEFIVGDNTGGNGSFVYDNARSSAPTLAGGDGFQNINVTGFRLTPGAFNDGQAGTPSASIAQFRFTRGDFDFNGAVDGADGSLIEQRVGRTLDNEVVCVDDQGNTLIIGGAIVSCPAFELRSANGLLAMRNMVTTDGPGGTNAAAVTQADADAWAAEFGCPPDLNNDGSINIFDIFAFFGLFGASDPRADFTGDGSLNIFDIFAFFDEFGAGC